ncbi:MAG: class I SAM-dependent methyltransferase [Candidatus Odinarchaeota archaeon]
MSKFNQALKQYWDKKSKLESTREKQNPIKQVHTDLLWREINRCITNRQKLEILDVGAGTGRFSIPIAQRGHSVTHLDISKEMIEITKEIANKKDLQNMIFVQQDLCKGLQYKENTFDLVLCLDSPLSYCYKNYENVIKDLIRVSKSKIIVCVSNRYGIITEGGTDFDLYHFGKLKTVKEVFETGNLIVKDQLRKLQPLLMPSWHGFTPEELERLLEKNSCIIERISAPGTLARFIKTKLLTKLFKDKANYKDFLDFEEKFDSINSILGIGAIGAGGLLVTAEKII